jgi:FKBP12-rapamycin complex-associated protein
MFIGSHVLGTNSLKIIARIQTPSANIRRNINNLLIDLGKHHPQALVNPLVVASKSPSAARKTAALNIMDRMRDHSATIVEQVYGFCYETHMANNRISTGESR